MNKAQNLLIRNECLKFAMNEGMTIKILNETTFTAEDDECIIDVPIDHLFIQAQQGHQIEDTLRNESAWKIED